MVLIGEMRDHETIESALRIAETGHLTFATLHTNSAAQTINRIIDVFPAHQQGQIRVQLSFVLEGILCQSLLPRAGGKGRALAMEILMPNSAIRNLIREDKVHQIYGMMQTGQAKYGMQTFNQSLAALYFKRMITPADGARALVATPTSCRRSSPAARPPLNPDMVEGQGATVAQRPERGADADAQLRLERQEPRRRSLRRESCSPTPATPRSRRCAASRSRSSSIREKGREIPLLPQAAAAASSRSASRSSPASSR